MQNILITGGAGFIGSHLARRLCSRYRITIADDLSTGTLENLRDLRGRVEIKIIALDSPDLRTWLKRKKFQAVFHLAGNAYTPVSVQAPLLDAHKNISGTLHLVQALCAQNRRPPRFIYASSAAVYGEPAALPIRETTPPRPISPYGIGKLAAEQYLHYFHGHAALPLQIIRFFSCYGPGQRKQVVYDLMNRLRPQPKSVTVLGTGRETRDLVYVEDLVRGLEICFQKGGWDGVVYQIATGTPVTVRRLAQTLRGLVSPGTRLKFDGRVRTGDPVRWEAAIDKINKLGFRPQVALEEGLRRTALWAGCLYGTGMDPQIAVVIPTHGRAESLLRTLRALAGQAEPFQVIVVEDGISPGWQAEAMARVAVPYPLVWRQQAWAGPAAARNLGWRASRAEVIAFLDDDVVPAPGWLAGLRAGLAAHPEAGGWEGKTVAPELDRPMTQSVENLCGGRYPSCNIAYTRTALERAGGFDERFTAAINEDQDLALTVLRQETIAFLPAMAAEHPPKAWRFGDAFRRRGRFSRDYFYGEILLYVKHPETYGRVRAWPHCRQTLRRQVLGYAWLRLRPQLKYAFRHPLALAQSAVLNLWTQVCLLRTALRYVF